MLITLDGIDGGGKSTQLARLADWLAGQGRRVTTLRDPGGTEAGEAIRHLVLESSLAMHPRCEALLYMAARSQLVEERIRPALAAGEIVLCDRFLLANVVYQSVQGREAPETLWQLGGIATGGLFPDLTLLLDLPAEVGLSRFGQPPDRMESRGLEYLQAVRQGFLSQLAACPGQTAVIDASQDVDAVAAAIRHEVSAALAEPRREDR